ncbi:MAG: hypothetical protein EAZ92_14760 [Candidatus Kapaibacterium sp.]|nr:MAG: hypothetical protein EAZ92_14760 [Candidatus Kapabacteria bacterium]
MRLIVTLIFVSCAFCLHLPAQTVIDVPDSIPRLQDLAKKYLPPVDMKKFSFENIKWQELIKIQGSASIFAESYLTTATEATQRRPPATARLMVNLSASVTDVVSIPVSFTFSTENLQFQGQGQVQSRFSQLLEQFRQAQQFSFNTFGIAPRFGKNVTLYAGMHGVMLSPLSLGDVRVNGGGLDIKVGSFRFVGTAGEAQQAFLPNPSIFRTGGFSQTVLAGRVEFAPPKGPIKVAVNALRARDNPLSLTTATGVALRDNTVLTTDFSVQGGNISADGEFAVSRNGQLFFNPLNQESCGFGDASANVSANAMRLDYAARFNLNYTDTQSPLTAQLKAFYVGPGYVTLGYPQFINDRLEVELAPRLRLFKNALNISGSIGFQTDNLAGDRASETRRIIGSANISAQPTEWFGIDASFQNYGLRVAPPPNYGVIIDPFNPPLTVQNIFALYSLAPRFMFTLGDYMQNVMLNASIQGFSDANPDTRRLTENSSESYRIIWTSMMQPLTLTLNVGYISNRSALANFAATDASITGVMPLFENKVTPSLTVNFTKAQESSGLDYRLGFQLRANYKVMEKVTAVLSSQINGYSYLPTARQKPYTEFQTSLELRYQL